MLNVFNKLYLEDLDTTSKYLSRLINDKSDISVLITGATGLIGSYLADAFVYYNETKHECFNIYILNRDKLKLKKRFGYCHSGRLHFVEQNVTDAIDSNIHFDYIFQLASNADPASYEKYPYETITTNVIGTYNIIEYLKNNIDTRVLFTSTMEVYGESLNGNIKENEYFPLDFNIIRSGYPESKRVSELMYKSAVKEYDINVKIARMGYIYGPTMSDNDNKIIAEFIRSVVLEQDIVLHSAGKQRRAYCYVLDAVNGIVAAIDKGENGEEYNIADSRSVLTLKDLAQTISALFGVKLTCEACADKDVYHTDINTKKSLNLDWNPIYDIKNGLLRTVKILKDEI